MTSTKLFRWVCAMLLAFGMTAVQAAELRIGMGAEVVAVDPHHVNTDSVNAVTSHVYDLLIGLDAELRLTPSLATSWRAVNDTTWEIKLRKGVKFHNGKEMTAEDVAYSIDRISAPGVASGPGFTLYTKRISGKKIVDPYTIHLTTNGKYPLLPNDLSHIRVVSKEANNTSLDDFKLGKVQAGTGPFKLVEFAKGDRVELVRSEQYWGPRPVWDKVTLRIITDNSARMAALLSGSVDVVENVQPDFVKSSRRGVALVQRPSYRVVYVYLDMRDTTPFAVDNNGKPLAKNPMQDIRVRQAISKLINREALTKHVVDGLAVPTGNIAFKGMYGHNPKLQPEKYDFAGAKKLLAEAGYPNGFGITFFTSNNRLINDTQVAQAISQMLTRGGIKTKVEAMPFATYLPRLRQKDMGFGLMSWGVTETFVPLRNLLMTENKEKGYGVTNYPSYSNPEFDRLVESAMSTVDEDVREKLLQDAAEIALKKDYAMLPLYNQMALWATREGLRYVPRIDAWTLAQDFQPKK